MNEYIEYVLVYLLLFFTSLLKWLNISKNLGNFIYISVWIFLALFSGTRMCVGQDWVGYGNFFSEAQQAGVQLLFSNEPTEYLYKLIAYIAISLGFSFEVFNLIVSLSTSFLIAISFNKISKDYRFLLTLIYFSTLYFGQQFGISRTGLAVGVFLYAYTIIDKSFLKFSGLSLIGVNIHRTSLVPSLLLFISKFLDKKYLLIFSIILLIFNFINNELGINFIKYVLQEFNFQYVQYLDDSDRYFQKIPVTKLTILTIFFILISQIWQIETKKILENFAIIFVVVNLVFNYAFIGRFNAYGSIIVIIYFIEIIAKSKGSLKIILVLGMYVYSFIGLSNVLFDPDLLLFRNYETWFFNFERIFSDCDTSLQY